MRAKVIMYAKLFEKGTPTDGHLNRQTNVMETYYPVFLKIGDSCTTYNLRGANGKVVYDLIQEGKCYAFDCNVNTSSEFESSRLTIVGLASLTAFNNIEDIVIASRVDFNTPKGKDIANDMNTTFDEESKDKKSK